MNFFEHPASHTPRFQHSWNQVQPLFFAILHFAMRVRKSSSEALHLGRERDRERPLSTAVLSFAAKSFRRSCLPQVSRSTSRSTSSESRGFFCTGATDATESSRFSRDFNFGSGWGFADSFIAPVSLVGDIG